MNVRTKHGRESGGSPNTAGSREGLVNVRTKHGRESGGPCES